MFKSVPDEILQRYLKFQTSPGNIAKGSISFLMTYFEEEYLKNKNLLSFPLHVVMKISNQCNMGCLHCSQKTVFRNESEIYMKKWKQVIDKIVCEGGINVSITGGEPLLHPQIKAILQYCKKKNLMVSVLTNGSLVDNDMGEFLGKHLDSTTDVVKLSVDDVGSEYKKIRQGGDFFKIKETISILKKNKVPVQVSMVVHNQNYKHIYDVYMFCVENKVDYIRYVPLFVHENTELRNALDRDILFEFDKVLKHNARYKDYTVIVSDPLSSVFPLLSWIKINKPDMIEDITIGKYICPAGIVSVEVDTEGNIYPCSYLNMDDFIIGNILDEDIKKTWKNNLKWNKIRERYTDNISCKKCNQLLNCLGGCPASSYYKHGEIGGGDASCFLCVKGNN